MMSLEFKSSIIIEALEPEELEMECMIRGIDVNSKTYKEQLLKAFEDENQKTKELPDAQNIKNPKKEIEKCRKLLKKIENSKIFNYVLNDPKLTNNIIIRCYHWYGRMKRISSLGNSTDADRRMCQIQQVIKALREHQRSRSSTMLYSCNLNQEYQDIAKENEDLDSYKCLKQEEFDKQLDLMVENFVRESVSPGGMSVQGENDHTGSKLELQQVEERCDGYNNLECESVLKHPDDAYERGTPKEMTYVNSELVNTIRYNKQSCMSRSMQTTQKPSKGVINSLHSKSRHVHGFYGIDNNNKLQPAVQEWHGSKIQNHRPTNNTSETVKQPTTLLNETIAQNQILAMQTEQHISSSGGKKQDNSEYVSRLECKLPSKTNREEILQKDQVTQMDMPRFPVQLPVSDNEKNYYRIQQEEEQQLICPNPQSEIEERDVNQLELNQSTTLRQDSFIKIPEFKNLGFDGTNNVDINDFIFKLENLSARAGINAKHLDIVLLEYISGDAYDFVWEFLKFNARASYEDIKRALLDWFEIRNKEVVKRRQLRERKQNSHEPVKKYILEMKKLNSQLKTPLLEGEMLDILKENLLREYRETLITTVITSINELKNQCEKSEHLWCTGVDRPYLCQPKLLSEEISCRHTKPDCMKLRKSRKLASCWNCNVVGHGFSICPIPLAQVFCFGCGRSGVPKIKCQKCNKRLKYQ